MGIGGAAIRMANGKVLLDTGYIISRSTDDLLETDSLDGVRTENRTTHLSSFLEYKDYMKSTTSNAHRDLGEGKLARKLAHDYEVVKLLAAHNCRLNKGFCQLQRWILATMPDTASDYLHDEPRMKVIMLCKAFQLRRCQLIKDYRVHWGQSYNGTCYGTFPVTSPSFTGHRFLELQQRNAMKQGDIIQCSEVATDTNITDKDNDLWHLHDMSFTKVKKYNFSLGDDRIGLIQVSSFGAHLQHCQMELPPRLSLLKMLARSQEVIEQLESKSKSVSKSKSKNKSKSKSKSNLFCQINPIINQFTRIYKNLQEFSIQKIATPVTELSVRSASMKLKFT